MTFLLCLFWKSCKNKTNKPQPPHPKQTPKPHKKWIFKEINLKENSTQQTQCWSCWKILAFLRLEVQKEMIIQRNSKEKSLLTHTIETHSAKYNIEGSTQPLDKEYFVVQVETVQCHERCPRIIAVKKLFASPQNSCLLNPFLGNCFQG